MAVKKAENKQPVIELVEGTTRTGISFQIDPRIKEDSRTLRYLTQMQKKSLDKMQQSEALFSLLELVFGSGQGLDDFMNEVAFKHDGVADVQSLIDEITDIFNAVDLKNS